MLTTCATSDELSHLLLGKMPPERTAELLAHVEDCPSCQERIADARVADDTLNAALHHAYVPTTFDSESALARALANIKRYAPSPQSIIPEYPQDLGTIRDYRLLAKLGEGGMGAVYKALHTRLDKLVALKVLPSDRMHPQSIARFQREMRAIGKLRHRHIVQASDAGEHDGKHYLVMELVEGVDLANVVRRTGPLPVADACELVRQTAVALQYAHEHGMVHRDIKPSNLMLDAEGQVKTLDLGLALLLDPGPAGQELTAESQTMGTADYLAPEQAGDSHNVDIRADIYSLGCTLYKLLTGEVPFGGPSYRTSLQKMIAHQAQPFPNVRSLRPEAPVELAGLLSRMVAKQPDERFATPAEVAQAIEKFCAGQDLLRLLAAATLEHAVDTSQSSVPTDPDLAAELVGTTPTRPRPLLAATLETTEAYVAAPASRSTVPPNNRRRMLIAVGAGALALLFAAVIVVRLKTREGTLVLTVDGPKPVVSIDDEVAEVTFDDTGKTYRIAVAQGEHKLRVTTPDGMEFSAPEKFIVKHGKETALSAMLEPKKLTVRPSEERPVSANPSKDKSQPTGDPHRAVAEWAINVGGKVQIENEQWLTSQTLPEAPFSIQFLSLAGCGIKDDDLDRVRTLKRLYALDLSDTAVTDAGMKRLEGMHIDNWLTLDRTGITDGAFDSLERISGVAALNLNGTQTTGVGWSRLKDLPKLVSLNLHVPGFTDSDAAALVGAPALASLSLTAPDLTAAGLEQLSKITRLTHLALYETKVTDNGLGHLAKLPNLAGLTIDASDASAITDRGAEHLGKMSELIFLQIGGVHQITDQGAIHLGQLQKLELLNANWPNLTAAGLTQIARARGLRDFQASCGPGITVDDISKFQDSLPNCRIQWGASEPDRLTAKFVLSHGGRLWINSGAEQAIEHEEELPEGSFQVTSIAIDSPAKKLSTCMRFPRPLYGLRSLQLENAGVTDHVLTGLDYAVLTSLNLRGNDITDAAIPKLLEAMNLRHLDLRETLITEQGATALRATLPNCTIEWSTVDPDHAAARWAQGIGGVMLISLGEQQLRVGPGENLPTQPFKLVSLDLRRKPVHDADLSKLTGLEALQELHLGNTGITDAGLVHLKGLTNLRFLELTATAITDEGLKHLTDLPNLRTIYLRETGMTDQGFESLERMSMLEELVIGRTKISEAGWKRVQDLARLKGLEVINANGHEPADVFVTDKDIANWVDLPLRHLVLAETRITEDAFKSISEMPFLTNLSLVGQPVTINDGLRHLSRSPRLNSLQLTGIQLTEQAVKHMAAIPNLRFLYALEANIDGALLERICQLRALEGLTIEGAAASDASVELLGGLTSLTHLELKNHRLTPAGVAKLKKLLPNCNFASPPAASEPTAQKETEPRE